jgi:hypothetical protein
MAFPRSRFRLHLKRRDRTRVGVWAVVLTAVLGSSGVGVGAGVAGAEASRAAVGPVTLPDLQILVPTDAISIGTNPSTGDRQLQFTHITWDAGAGPFLITPKPNRKTGTSSFTQTVYDSSRPGVWHPAYKVQLPVQGVFDPPSDYRYPLTRFTLNELGPGGAPGTVVATSPKTDYCITADAYVGGVPNTPNQTSPPQSNCTSPKKSLGLSVGWGDEYDQTDNGQPIDLTGIADGTYVLQATVDPLHIFRESDASNDVVDTTLQISGDNVTVDGQSQPTVVPPTVSLTGPTSGASVSGTVTLQASAAATSPATVASVQYLLDGQPLAAPVTSAPYDFSWDTANSSPGSHTLSAEVTDSNGTNAVSSPVTVTVTPTPCTGLCVDASKSKDGKNVVKVTKLSTSSAGDTLLAFVSGDGPAGSDSQSSVVSTPGLTWSLLQREDQQSGVAEIWGAHVAGTLSRATVTSRLALSGYDEQLTVLALRGTAGIGSSGVASGPEGTAPSLSLTSSAAGSLSFAVGEDWDNPIARTLGSGQSLVSQWVDTRSGDTFWVQATSSKASSSGEDVTLDDVGPTSDQWNMAAVEVLPGSNPAGATPAVYLTNPVRDQTVSGKIDLEASASADSPIRSVQFMVDGRPAGRPLTRAPFVLDWNTRSVPSGPHSIAAVATTSSGVTTQSAVVSASTQNPAPPMTCFVLQTHVSARGQLTATTPGFHTASAGEVLVAFVTAIGGANHGGPEAKVVGAGLRWHLVRRARSGKTDVEIWSADAHRLLNRARVESIAEPGVNQKISVIAMEGVDGTGSAVASGGAVSPHLDLKTSARTSLVFAVGSSPGPATRPAEPGWVSLDSDTQLGGNTIWTRFTNDPTGRAGSEVQIQGSAPSAAGDLVAVELTNDDH